MSLILSGSSGLSDVDGSASTPSLRGTDADSGVFFPAADTVAIATGGSERARVDSSGNVLVGTTDSSITAGVGAKIRPGQDGAFTAIDSATTSVRSGFLMYSTGASAFRFYVGFNGTIYATSTSITGISDVSLKANIRDLETGLSQVMALKPRRFDWKEETQNTEKNVAGFIAQEVEEILPELVYDYQYNADETKKALKMGDMVPTLVKAIQEQQALITSLTARIAALEGAAQ